MTRSVISNFSLPGNVHPTLSFIVAITPQPDARALWIAGGAVSAEMGALIAEEPIRLDATRS
jgi:hypothetical protein